MLRRRAIDVFVDGVCPTLRGRALLLWHAHRDRHTGPAASRLFLISCASSLSTPHTTSLLPARIEIMALCGVSTGPTAIPLESVPTPISPSPPPSAIYRQTRNLSSSKDVDITYAPALPGPIPAERPDPSKANPRLGVGQIMSWSVDGRYLATRNDNMASTLWVWDAEDLSLASVVVQASFLFFFFCYEQKSLMSRWWTNV